MQRNPVSPALLILLMSLTFLFAGCVTAMNPKPANVLEVGCASGSMDWDVAPEAEIQSFDCSLGVHEGEDSLIYAVAVKNVSDQPHRFRLTIFLEDMDKGVAYYVPVKGKPPVVPPGETQKVTIPFMKTTRFAKQLSVAVKTAD